MILLVLGGVVGAGLGLVLYGRARREVARLEEERSSLLEEREVVLQFMHSMVDAVGERLPREELFQRIVHAATRSTGALSACIFEKGADDRMRGVAIEGLFPPHRPIPDTQRMLLGSRAQFIAQVLKSEAFPVGEGIVGRVAATGRGELVTDAPTDPRVVRHDDPALTVRSVIAAPITARGRLIGVLCVCNAADGLPFTTTDYSLVAALAEQAGLAVHNADFLSLQMAQQQLDLDLALAGEVQRMLLPAAMPAVPGLDLDARYRAAERISGDLYDAFPLADGRLAVAVADVAGKGIPASLLMAIVRTLLRQLAPSGDSPAAVLTAVNRALADSLRGGMYVTIVYAVVDVARGQVTLARAGHERPVLARPPATGREFQCAFVGGEGLPLGLVPTEEFAAVIEDCVVPLLPGDVLVLYTDGLTEAPNPDEKEFGGARLTDTLRGVVTAPAAAVNDALLAAVARFGAGTRLRDDYTLVTVRRP